MFSGEGPEVGIFTIQNSAVSLEILPTAYEQKDTLILPILKSMQDKIVTEEMLNELMETNSVYSSLQFYKF